MELDLRDHGDRLVLQHDPFMAGEDFEKYLEHYDHGTMILNIKSERIEHRVLELIGKYNVKDYFFLDSSFPMIYALSKQGETNLAIRFSEYEGIDTILNMKGKAGWIWVDCFTRLPIDKKSYQLLREANFKFCLVSPELQGREEDIPRYREYLESEGIIADAVCTKIYNFDKWR